MTILIYIVCNNTFQISPQVVVSVEHFVAAAGHVCLLVLTRPSAHNKNFPYHVRTTQIGIMEAMSGNTNLGNNRLDGFSHGGNYGVSQQATSGMDVFTVDSVGRNPSPQPLPTRALANGSQPPLFFICQLWAMFFFIIDRYGDTVIIKQIFIFFAIC